MARQATANLMDDGERAVTDKAPWRRFLPAAVLLAGLAFGYAMGWHQFLTLDYLAESRTQLLAWRDANPVLAPAAFAFLYALAVAFSFPAASVLTIFGGFLFGWVTAAILVAFAATIGATILFLVARTAFGGFLRDKVGGKVARFAEGFEKNAFSYLLALRLAPVFPFFVVNIAPALFDVPLRTYVTATFLGILPGVVAYSWLGQGVDSVLVAADEAGRSPALSDLVTTDITIAFVSLALVALVPAVVRTLRQR
jgi:uncharacterized membrane protein YdjX (TVP38/TMEM64 family)